ncbi:unnamed protein product [Parascedosporium putredinis]|uniref:Antigenic thaumatin-like protein n=1 Tax=Parascedosporium putredinis TaxID=1442378 RepID=A0A9P1MAP0_9PEZI|nr:unnamed protein product [Parascedosporium putredinis]CAI7993123.1 unnamed protein product [Parascedosporium putredinis]
MRFFTTLAAVVSSATAVAAVGSAHVVNQCDEDVSVWSVGGEVAGPWRLKANGGSYSEEFSRDAVTGGRSLKVTIPEDGLWTGAPQTNFAYNLDGSQVWYDLSDVFGDAFEGHKLTVSSDNGGCAPIVWEDGTPPAGSQVKVCTSDDDLVFTLCAA